MTKVIRKNRKKKAEDKKTKQFLSGHDSVTHTITHTHRKKERD